MKKRAAILLMMLIQIPAVYAAETANINIKISGAIHDNRYFMCMPDVGCLSILAAKKGKVFSMINPLPMNTIFITNTRTMRVYNQGLPKSCDTTVQPNKTITIYGNLVKQHHDKVVLQHLRCVIT